MALLLLRIAAAFMLAAAGFYISAPAPHPWLPIALAIPGLLLFLGLGTRIIALVCAIIAVCLCVGMGGWRGTIIGLETLNFVAIALLGAGAYSIDARLFGRRIIKLDN